MANFSAFVLLLALTSAHAVPLVDAGIGEELNNSECAEERLGDFKIYDKPNGDKGILFCVKENNACTWTSLDGSPTLGQSFNPAKDCVDVVEHFPGAKNGFYWITVPGNKMVEVWCDVHIDGGGFMLVGKANRPNFWSVPSNSTPISPTGPESWSSDLGSVQMQEFGIQVLTSVHPENTIAYWVYRLNERRQLGELFGYENNFCTDVASGIGNVEYVKDIMTETVVNAQFNCSKFGPHYSDALGWARLNYCLRNKCPRGYAFLDGIDIQFDEFGSFSYSAHSAQSGMTHDATAFVGCHNKKCCACYGPRGGRQHYCRPDCVAINGGHISNQATVLFWDRTRTPTRVWRRCMEFQKTDGGNVSIHHMDVITGNVKKGSCSSQSQILLNEGTLTVKDQGAQGNVPPVPGLISYREDNQELYVNNGKKWEAISSEQEVAKLNETTGNMELRLERKIEKLTETVKNITTRLTNVQDLLTSLSQSVILGNKPAYLAQLGNWLPTGLVLWKQCWRASVDGWASSVFHRRCNGKGATVTIIQVGQYVFGGYSNVDWQGSGYANATTFIFSLKNKYNVAPFKSNVYRNSQNAVYRRNSHGPTFGGGHDIYIASNAGQSTSSYTNFGYTYRPPSGYSYRASNTKALLAGSYRFTPTEIEVFYRG